MNGTPFFALLKASGQSNKDSDAAAGSFNYQPPFVASSIAFLAACKIDLASRRVAIDSAE